MFSKRYGAIEVFKGRLPNGQHVVAAFTGSEFRYAQYDGRLYSVWGSKGVLEFKEIPEDEVPSPWPEHGVAHEDGDFMVIGDMLNFMPWWRLLPFALFTAVSPFGIFDRLASWAKGPNLRWSWDLIP